MNNNPLDTKTMSISGTGPFPFKTFPFLLPEWYEKPALIVKKFHPDAISPTKAHPGDLGYDLYSLEDVDFTYGEVKKIRTGIGVCFPENYGGLVKDRSSMASRGFATIGGVIDSGYRGEIAVIMSCFCRVHDRFVVHTIKKGDKIAQIVPIETTEWEIHTIGETQEFAETSRNDKGFGSSGV